MTDDQYKIGRLFQGMKKAWFEIEDFEHVSSWEELDEGDQEKIIDEIFSLADDNTTFDDLRDLHNFRYNIMQQTGWTFGKEHDEENKISPFMKPFNEMSKSYRDDCMIKAAVIEVVTEEMYD